MPPAINVRVKGETIIALTDIEPADSPPTVIRFGSPPNAAILRFTQASAAAWSSSP